MDWEKKQLGANDFTACKYVEGYGGSQHANSYPGTASPRGRVLLAKQSPQEPYSTWHELLSTDQEAIVLLLLAKCHCCLKNRPDGKREKIKLII